MPRWDYQQFYRRGLPHLQPPGATLFVTFRLAGSIPQALLRQYAAQKQWLEIELQRIKKQPPTAEASEVAAHEERLLTFKRRWFAKFEDVLHRAEHGPTWLSHERLAEMVAEALHYRAEQVFHLDAYCIMPNHVHAVFAPLLAEGEWREVQTPEGIRFEANDPEVVLSALMQSLKGYTSYQANRILERRGEFWEHESYDHVVRNEQEFARIVAYVLNNPVKAGLVKDWREWRWSYRRPGC